MAKRLEDSKFKIYNDYRVLKSAGDKANWARKQAEDLAKAGGESYLTVMKGKKITSLKCVLRFGKEGLKKCPSRSKKACKRIMVVQCRPTRKFRPTKWLKGARRKKR